MLNWRDFSSVLNKGLFVNASFPNLIILSNVKDQIPILSTKLIPFNSEAVGSVSIVRLAHCCRPIRIQNEDLSEGDRFIIGFVLSFYILPCFLFIYLFLRIFFLFLILGHAFSGQIPNIYLKAAGHDNVG